MSRYKDERLLSEQNTMKAMMFDYIFIGLLLTLLLKLYILEDYSQVMKIIDYGLFFTTVLLALILQFKSKVDFYAESKYTKKSYIVKALFIGTCFVVLKLSDNNFQYLPEQTIMYILEFLNGVLFYTIIFMIVNKIKQLYSQFLERIEDLD